MKFEACCALLSTCPVAVSSANCDLGLTIVYSDFQGTPRNVKQEQQVMGLSSSPVLPRPPAGSHATECLRREKVVGLDGIAGAGKTTTLSVIREGAEAEGYRVEGFAPTSRAAQKLGEADLLNSRMAYVSVSRGRYDAQIYTNNARTLGEELSRDVSHSPAIQQEPGAHKTEPQTTHTNQISHGFGLGL